MRVDFKQCAAKCMDFNERKFFARAERQHVNDIRAAMDEMQRAGESIEEHVRKSSPLTQQECESLALQLTSDTMVGILKKAIADSHERWDASGQHHYFSPKKWLGIE